MTISRAPSRARSDILAATPRRVLVGGMVVSRVDLQNAARQRNHSAHPFGTASSTVFYTTMRIPARSGGGARVIKASACSSPRPTVGSVFSDNDPP